jgi:GDP-mannose 6-dehydrogenase
MRVCVIGLGYVGAVTAVCLARDGHSVLGIDLDPVKLDLLRRGQPPIIEEGLHDVTRAAAESGRLEVADRVDERIAACDLIFVCVGTPSAPNGSQNLGAVERVAEQIGSALKSASGFPVVVVRSTIYPGTTDSVVRPLLEKASGKGANRDFGLCFQPEFLREGSSIKDYYTPPFTIVGSDSPRAIEPLRQLFGALPCEFIVTDTRNAEMMKLACNAFHALKVSFANEIGRLGRSLGVDAREVMDLMCKDRSLNISPAYMKPGYAYGGSCLPKDLRALQYMAKRNDVELPLLAGIAHSNVQHIEHAFAMVRESGHKRVGMIGLSFKAGTDDLRESPLVTLAEQLIGKGYDLRIYDPAVSLARLVGANKRYIEHTIAHIGSLLSESLEEVAQHAEILIVGHRTPEAAALVAQGLTAGKRIVDLVGLADAGAQAGYAGICW